MRTFRSGVVAFLGVLLTVAAGTSGVGLGGTPGTPASAQRDQPRGVTGVVSVSVGRVRLRDTPPLVSPAFLAAQGRKITKANPRARLGGPAPVAYDPGPPTLLPGSPVQPDPTPGRPSVPSIVVGEEGGQVRPTSRRGQRPNAAGDFRVFRRTAVISGVGVTPAGTVVSTSSTNEPTIANDRDGILFTGNWYAAWSEDAGISWKYIDPATDISTQAGGFCCDQVVVSVPRDGYNMLLWNLQYSNDASGNNAFQIISLRGRSALNSLEYCSWPVTPAWAGYGVNRWFDFEILGVSNDWLYVTTNVFNTSTPAAFLGSEVIRMNLDDLEDCVDARATRWSRSEYHVRPVQGAGADMYFGALADTNTLRLMRVADSSSTLSSWDRDVTTFASAGGSGVTCPSPGGGDPCGRLAPEINAAYRSGSEVGLMWTQGNNVAAGLAMPSTRIARFRTSDMELTNEHTIWNDSFAWALPAVTVNGSGDKGGTIQAIGGTLNTQTQGFLIDGYSSSWQPLPNVGLNGGTNGPSNNRWGDYFGVQVFRGCSDTFLGAYAYLSGGGGSGSAVGESAWFGREGEACPDLRITSVVLGIPLRNLISGGGAISVADVTQNIGSGNMPTSVTAYYLSRNNSIGSSDERIGQRAIPAVAAGASNTGTVAGITLPSGTFGKYYVIACADDGDPVDEVSDSNNCQASRAFSVKMNVSAMSVVSTAAIRSVSQTNRVVLRRGIRHQIKVTGLVKGGKAGRPVASVFITRNPQWSPSAVKVGSGVTDPSPVKQPSTRTPGEWSFTLDVAVRMPSRLSPGTYFVIACLDDPTPITCGALDARFTVPPGKSVPAVRP